MAAGRWIDKKRNGFWQAPSRRMAAADTVFPEDCMCLPPFLFQVKKEEAR